MAKITKLKVNYGLSFEEDGIWHKPEAGIEIELDEDDSYEDFFKEGWDICKDQLQKQLNEDDK